MVTVDILPPATSGRHAQQHGGDAILSAAKSAIKFAEVNGIGCQWRVLSFLSHPVAFTEAQWRSLLSVQTGYSGCLHNTLYH
jgi:hypothetical protein